MTTSVYETVNRSGETLRTTDNEIAQEWREVYDFRVTAFVPGRQA